MPDEIKDVFHYTTYFNVNVPNSGVLLLFLFLIGAVSGMVSSLFIHLPVDGNFLSVSLLGATSGILVISVPAALTVILIKTMKRKLLLKRAIFANLAIASIYGVAIITDAAIFSILNNYVLSYLLLILANAGVYGYWFFINKFAIGQKKSAILTSAVQPILNILLFIPLGKYILNFNTPLNILLIKLFFGMVVFLAIGYFILYLLDRPAKKMLNISGTKIFITMVNQWLYDIKKDSYHDILGNGGVQRDVKIDILALRGSRGYKAIFVKPDIHYGPFSNIGGSVAPEHIGNILHKNYKATPFILHGSVNIADNPISASQIYEMSKRVHKCVNGFRKSSFNRALGGLSFGYDAPCRAINIKIGDINLLTLTKAPTVTEDINRSVGLEFEKIANKNATNTILIDAHNSRFESASKDELKGIPEGSKYISRYENAIREATKKAKTSQLRFGSSTHKIYLQLKDSKDIGRGNASVGVFEFKDKKFCMIYLDANNMLPKFREGLVSHIKKKFGLEAEIYTTDTHSVNSLALSVSNVLGRTTELDVIIPILNEMITKAINDVEPVNYAYKNIEMKDFKVWGEDAEEIIIKLSRSVIRTSKRVIPFIIVAGFIIAAWVIYIV